MCVCGGGDGSTFTEVDFLNQTFKIIMLAPLIVSRLISPHSCCNNPHLINYIKGWGREFVQNRSIGIVFVGCVKYTCIAPILFTNIHRRFYDDEDDEMTMT